MIYSRAGAAAAGLITFQFGASSAAQCHSAPSSSSSSSSRSSPAYAAVRRAEVETLAPVRLLPRIAAFTIDTALLGLITWALRRLFGVDAGSAWARLTSSAAWRKNEVVTRIAFSRVDRRRQMARKSWWISDDAEETVEDVRGDACDVLTDAAGCGQSLSEICSALAAVQLARTPYRLLSHWLMCGQTVGERVVGLRVVTVEGDRPTLPMLLRRESVEFAFRTLTYAVPLRKEPQAILESVVAPLEIHEVSALMSLAMSSDMESNDIELKKRAEDFLLQVGSRAGEKLPTEFTAIVPGTFLFAAVSVLFQIFYFNILFSLHHMTEYSTF